MTNVPVPLVSIVIPAYQHADFVGEAIDSVLAQGLTDLELIVIDDASDDGTWEVIQRYDDPRMIARRHEKNRGAANTINEGIEAARGTYVAILNSDDVYHPNRLERMTAIMEARGVDLLGSDMRLIDGFGKPIEDPSHWWVEWYEELKHSFQTQADITDTLISGNLFIATSNFFLRRETFEKSGVFSAYRYVHDYEFILRCLSLPGLRVDFLEDECLLSYRLHGSNTIREDPLAANRETFELLLHFLPILVAPGRSRRGEIAAAHLARVEGHLERLLKQEHRSDSDRFQEIIERQARTIEDSKKRVEELEAQHQASPDEMTMITSPLSYRVGRSMLSPIRVGQRLLRRFSRIERANSISQLREMIDERIPGVRLVSFDVFDTLLARRIDPPEAIHEELSRVFSEILEDPRSPSTLLELRKEAEAELRQREARRGNDSECRHDELLDAWVQKVTGSNDQGLSNRLRRIELDLEIAALEVKPGIEALLVSLEQREISLIALSDMYLSGESVRELLDAKGLGGYFDRVHVSSDYRAGKGSGRLFSAVLAEHHCSPAEMLHVGDNEISDHRSPIRRGIRAIHLREPNEFKRKTLLRRYGSLASKNPYWRGRHLLQIAHGFSSGRSGVSFDYRYGRDVLGPIFCTFTLSLVERLRDLNPERVYFLARDGYLLRRLYQELAPALGYETISDEYIHLSRHTAFAASIENGLSPEKAAVALYSPVQQGLLSIFKVFGLDPEEFASQAARHGFTDPAERILDPRDPRLLAFLADDEVQYRIRQHGARSRELMEGYLAQQGFFDAARIALIDIGWNGTIQYGLEQLPRWKAGGGEAWGLYFAFCGRIPYPFEHPDRLEGLWSDHRRENAREEVTLACEEIFEEAARAPHATTLGYREAGARIEPIPKEDPAPDRMLEIACNSRVADIQRGVMNFAEDFSRAIRLTGYTADDIRPFMLTLMERAIAFPTPDEVAAVSSLSHSDDFGHETVTNFSDLSTRRPTPLRPRRFLRSLRASNWRYAFLRGPLRLVYRLYASRRRI